MGESQNSDPYAPAIADLEAKIAELQTALNTLRSIRSLALGAVAISGGSVGGSGVGGAGVGGAGVGGGGLRSASGGSDSKPQIAVDAFHTLTVGKAITKYLRMRPRRPATTAEIIEALKAGGQANADGNNFAVVVNNTLNRMQGPDSTISRVKRGLWGLQEWYRNDGDSGTSEGAA